MAKRGAMLLFGVLAGCAPAYPDPTGRLMAPSRNALSGATCGAATSEIDNLAFVANDDTTGQGDDYNLGAAGVCAGGGDQYADTGIGPDVAFKFTTDLTCDLTAEMLGAGDMNVTVVTDCADLAASCVRVSDGYFGSETESVTFTAEAGVTYYLIVDGYGGDSSAFTLDIYEDGTTTGCDFVAPSVKCDGTNDGAPCDDPNPCNDGFCTAGACVGTPNDANPCTDDDACTDDACVGGACVGTLAARCARCQGLTPIEAALPHAITSNTSGGPDEFRHTDYGTCAGGGTTWDSTGSGPDEVRLFRVDRVCDLELTMSPPIADLTVMVVGACGDLSGACFGLSDDYGAAQPETVSLAAQPGTDYFVVVDDSSSGGGQYVLTIRETSATGCALGPAPEVCDGSNDGAPCDDGNPCTGQDTCVAGACSPGPPNDLAPCTDGNPCTDDACSSGVCVSAPDDTNGCPDAELCTVERCEAGACVVTPSPGCNVCAGEAWLEAALPAVVAGTTIGGSDDLDIDACPASSTPYPSSGEGPDHVVRFQVDRDCDLHLVLEAARDALALYVVNDCGDLEGSCVEFRDSTGTTEEIDLAAQAGVDYFAVVDGSGGGSSDFELRITEEGFSGCALVAPAFACDGGNDGAPCDDGNPCTGVGTCTSGVCLAANDDARTCDDGNPCTDDVCQAGACVGSNDDGNACSDDNRCTDDACVAGACVAQDDDANTCSDGVLCTDDVCVAGACVSAPTDCSEWSGDCRTGVCNPGTGFCESLPFDEGGGCDDGDACTEVDRCTLGTCGGTTVDCSSLDLGCQVGACDPSSGLCAPAPRDCGYLDEACRVGACDVGTGACSVMPRADGTACDDFDACTDSDECLAGACAGEPVVCTDPCNVGSCDSVSGACVFIPAFDGNACDDGDACTADDACDGGACRGAALDCSSLDAPCQEGTCVAGACQSLPAYDGETCDDEDACTKLDACTAGACAGVPKDCSAFTSACATGACEAETGACAAIPIADGTACDAAGCAGACQSGLCAASDTCAGDGGPTGGDSDGPPPTPSGCASAGAGAGAGALGAVALLRRRRRRGGR